MDTYVSRAGIPDFQGCIEDKAMLSESIKKVEINKLAEFYIIWLGFENVYESLRHALIQKAIEFFWILEVFSKFRSTLNVHIRFSSMRYSSEWQKLNTSIMTGCETFLLLLVL